MALQALLQLEYRCGEFELTLTFFLLHATQANGLEICLLPVLGTNMSPLLGFIALFRFRGEYRDWYRSVKGNKELS